MNNKELTRLYTPLRVRTSALITLVLPPSIQPTPILCYNNITSRTKPDWIIIPFDIKKVFIQEGAGPAGTFNETIHNAQNATKTIV